MEFKKTLILGASTNATRYAYLAANSLVSHGHSIVNIGMKSGIVAGVAIEQPGEVYQDIDTITLYISPENQPPLYDYILNTKPKRILFNPGSENQVLQQLAVEQGIITDYACTLVLLATGQY